MIIIVQKISNKDGPVNGLARVIHSESTCKLFVVKISHNVTVGYPLAHEVTNSRLK
jgi:hypothetical protein